MSNDAEALREADTLREAPGGPHALRERGTGHRLLFELARGGMGTVHLAHRTGARGFERLVVIKRIHPHLAEVAEFRDMFADEARLASQIRGPHVVPVEDVVAEGQELALVQPYVESVPLSALLRATAKSGDLLAPPVVARILADVLDGLSSAHEAIDLRGTPLGIVHRDVSPQNILVGTDGRSLVIDFGIAKAARRLTVTRSGVLKGKIGYMAPEHLRRGPIGPRADVYSAGVVLYEALTGVRPFKGEDEADTLLAVLMGNAPAPSELRPGLPAHVDAVLEKALAAGDERFDSALDLREALVEAIPPAAPAEVATVVEVLLGADLEARRKRIRACLDAEVAQPLSEPALVFAAGSANDAATARVQGRAPTAGSRARVVVFAVGAVVVAGVVSWGVWASRPPHAQEEARGPTTPAPSSSSPVLVDVAPSALVSSVTSAAPASSTPPTATWAHARHPKGTSSPTVPSVTTGSPGGAPLTTASPGGAPLTTASPGGAPLTTAAPGMATELHPNPYAKRP